MIFFYCVDQNELSDLSIVFARVLQWYCRRELFPRRSTINRAAQRRKLRRPFIDREHSIRVRVKLGESTILSLRCSPVDLSEVYVRLFLLLCYMNMKSNVDKGKVPISYE
jgi:hypothetical protein